MAPFREQLFKWVGSKQRVAHEIVACFPSTFNTYFEPFLGAGGVLATLAPSRAIASDVFRPLMEIWQALHEDPAALRGATFLCMDYQEAMEKAESRDLVYCDPPYDHAQRILYGHQGFSLQRLVEMIAKCKSRAMLRRFQMKGRSMENEAVADRLLLTY